MNESGQSRTILGSVLGVSSMFVVEHRDVVSIIDTGSPWTSVARILRGVRRLGREPEDVRQIVLTHCHGDHAGRAKALLDATGATVVAGQDDVAVIEGRAPYPGPKGPARSIYERMGSYDRLAVDRAISGQEELDGGLVAIPTPGHTAGHISVLAPDLDALFIGDTIWNLGLVRPSWRPFTHDRERNMESIRELAGVAASKVYPGHGPAFRADHIARLARRS